MTTNLRYLKLSKLTFLGDVGGLDRFKKKLRAVLIESAKKRAKELHANAIVDLNISEGLAWSSSALDMKLHEDYDVWKCIGTAVRVFNLEKKESSSEESDSSEAFQGGIRR